MLHAQGISWKSSGLLMASLSSRMLHVHLSNLLPRLHFQTPGMIDTYITHHVDCIRPLINRITRCQQSQFTDHTLSTSWWSSIFQRVNLAIYHGGIFRWERMEGWFYSSRHTRMSLKSSNIEIVCFLLHVSLLILAWMMHSPSCLFSFFICLILYVISTCSGYTLYQLSRKKQMISLSTRIYATAALCI